jgi:hypothetical protein
MVKTSKMPIMRAVGDGLNNASSTGHSVAVALDIVRAALTSCKERGFSEIVSSTKTSGTPACFQERAQPRRTQ